MIIYELSTKIKYIKNTDSENKFKVVEKIVQMCPRIRSIELTRNLNFFDYYEYYSAILPIVLENCHTLSELCCSFKHLNENLMNQIVDKYSTCLKVLNLYNIDSRCEEFLMKFSKISYLIIDNIENVFTNCKTVHQYNFLKKLKHIELQSMNSIQDVEKFDLIFSNATQINSVKILFFTKIDDKLLNKLYKSYDKLSELKILTNHFLCKFE